MTNLNHLYYFQQIAKTGSIRKAAETMYVSESALSKALRQLEKEMACQLFIRNGKRLQINEEGLYLLHLVDDLLNRANELKPKLDTYRGICTQIIMDTPFDFPVEFLIQDVLKTHFPDTQFYLKNTLRTQEQHIKDLQNGVTDITVIPIDFNYAQKQLPLLLKEGISSIFLMMESLYLSVPEGHPLSDVNAMPAAEVKNNRLVRIDNSYATVWYEEILTAKHQSPVYHYKIDPNTFLKDWAAFPMAFPTTSLYMTHKDYLNGFARRHQIRLTDPEATRAVFLFYRNDHSRIIDLFITIFKQQFYELFSIENSLQKQS